MPRSQAQKKKKAAKKKAIRKEARQIQAIEAGVKPARLKGGGAYSLSDAITKAKEVAFVASNYEPTSGFGKATQAAVEAGASSFGVPSSIARSLGNAASYLTKFFGAGRYGQGNPTHNSFASGTSGCCYASGFVTAPMATFAGANGPTVRLRHSEFVLDWQSSIAFTKYQLPLNPGNPLLMPWGSQIARLYEVFRWRGLVFEYRPTTASGITSATGAMGSVLMATDYDCYDSGYDDKRSMEASMFAVQATPFERALHPVECAKSMNVTAQQYVQPGLTVATDAPGDERLSVLGNFTIASVGNPANGTNVGELWVHYDLELSRPILEDNNTGFSQHLVLNINSANSTQSAISNSHPNTGMLVGVGTNYSRVGILRTDRVRAGTYLVNIMQRAVSGNTTGIAPLGNALIPSFTNCTFPLYSTDAFGTTNNANYIQSGLIGSSPYIASYACTDTIMVTMPDAASTFEVQLQPILAPGGVSYIDIFITQYNVLWNSRLEKRLNRSAAVDTKVTTVQTDVARVQGDLQEVKSQLARLLASSGSSSTPDSSLSAAAVSDSEDYVKEDVESSSRESRISRYKAFATSGNLTVPKGNVDLPTAAAVGLKKT